MAVPREKYEGKRIRGVKYIRESPFLGVALEFEEGGTFTILMYRKDVPWEIALARDPHEVGMCWNRKTGYQVVCHSDHFDEEVLSEFWNGRRLNRVLVAESGGGPFGGIILDDETWKPSIHYFTKQGIGDTPSTYFNFGYKD